LILTVKQAHEKLNKAVGINQLRILMRDGAIRSQWLGNKLITTEKDINLWFERRQKKQDSILMPNS
jgi:hypothetical protein